MKHRRFVFWASVISALTLASMAYGQVAVKEPKGIGGQAWYFMVGAGPTVPTSSIGRFPDYEGRYKTGIAGRVGAAFLVSDRLLFGPEFEYQHYVNKDLPDRDRNVSIYAATARYSLPLSMPKSRAESKQEQNTAYIFVASVGLAAIDEWGETSSSGLVSGGFGIMRRYARHFTVTLDARWQYTFDHGEHFVPVVLMFAF